MPIPLPSLVNSFQVDPSNFVAGRGACAAPVAVVLHSQQFTPGELIARMCRENTAFHGPHTSFHFALDPNSNWAAKFVNEADTAISFSTETPPVLPAGCNTSTPDQRTINIVINWPSLMPGEKCPAHITSNLSLLCELLAHIFTANNIVPDASTLLIAVNELPGLDLTALLQCVKNYIAAPPLQITDRACFPSHITTQDMALPVAVWDGNCLREVTRLGEKEYCDYTAQVVTVDGGKLLSATLGDKTYIAPNGGIDETNVIAIRNWLNSLVVAPATFNVSYGFSGDVASLTITLTTSDKVLAALVFSNTTVAPTQSNCVTLPAQVPITVQDVLAQVSITYSAGVISANGVHVVTGTPIYDSNNVLLGYAMPI